MQGSPEKMAKRQNARMNRDGGRGMGGGKMKTKNGKVKIKSAN